MDPIYVIGHRNPDTDSIVSAMAYAALYNALGDREYVAGRIGHISDETNLVLQRFGFAPPLYIKNLYTQVKDLDYDRPPVLSAAVTVSHAWAELQADRHLAALPVVDRQDHFFAMLSPSDIAEYGMETVDNPYLQDVPVFNLLSVLEGKIMNDGGNGVDTLSGEVVIALPKSRDNLLFSHKESIVICGDQPEMLQRALDIGVNCLIVCQAELPESMRRHPADTCIISTPFDAARVLKIITQAIPVERICRDRDIHCFQPEDYVDNVREVVLKENRFRSFPIVDEEGHVLGTLSRSHLLRPKRKQVILMDHNEAAQSVQGLQQAEILAIIDHHRLADIQTGAPIYFRNEPVGSTTTIVAEMYQEKGLMPSEKLAGLMAAAILSDTVIFKSPTCTERDKLMAQRMARIANVDLEQLGREIFSASYADDKPAQSLLMNDFKEFHIAGHDFGVGQITCVDSHLMLQRREEFLKAMQDVASQRHYSMVMLMITDVLKEGTQLLYLGDEDVIRQAFSCEPKDNTVFLPEVMSRKKQVIPMLTAMWG